MGGYSTLRLGWTCNPNHMESNGIKITCFDILELIEKAGIDVMTNTLGVEWAEYGIRTVGLAPGGIAGTVGGPTGRVFGR